MGAHSVGGLEGFVGKLWGGGHGASGILVFLVLQVLTPSSVFSEEMLVFLPSIIPIPNTATSSFTRKESGREVAGVVLSCIKPISKES